MTIIEAEELKKVYGNGRQQVVALEGFNLQVEKGEFVVIVGSSGCGKSTFLLAVAGLESISGGTLLFKRKPIVGPGSQRGIVFQEYALFPWRTVAENIEFGPEMAGFSKERRMEIISRYVNLIGLQGFENRYPYELSGGMRQRVAIDRALANEPEILLMDEPFGSLDALTREILQVELLRIWRETKSTVIFVTHNITEAIYLGDKVAVMSRRPGKIKKVIKIDLPRLRNEDMRMLPEFVEHERQLKRLVREEV